MNYEVVWTPVAEDELADIWVNTPDQAAVTQAAERIDNLLGRFPTTVGESRPPRERILIERPLTVFYEVIEDDKRVRVLRVRTTRA